MEQPNADQSNLIKEVTTPVYQARGWMKFIGVLMIIGGILYALTIVGIIIAWLPIWMGVVLLKAGSSSEQAYFSGDKYSLIKSLNQIKLYFTIMGILTLISIVFSAIAIIAFIAGGFAFGEFFDGGYY
ncbi:MAG: DUF5362 family protein [Bacteroidales bacterium]|nr:DUF5362 family protein [Bacteroidales bacterium]